MQGMYTYIVHVQNITGRNAIHVHTNTQNISMYKPHAVNCCLIAPSAPPPPMCVSLVPLGLLSEVHLQHTAVLPTAQEHVRRVWLQCYLTRSRGGRREGGWEGREGGRKEEGDTSWQIVSLWNSHGKCKVHMPSRYIHVHVCRGEVIKKIDG